MLKESLIKARKIKEEKQELLRERRQEKILAYLSDHPGQTAYKLSKVLNINSKYIANVLQELSEAGLIKLEKVEEQNKIKFMASPLTIRDVDWDNFHEENLNDPIIQYLIDKTMNKGGSVILHKKNGEEVELKPSAQLTNKE